MEKGISALEEMGVYYGVSVKNHKYWPKGVPGDEIDRNFYKRYVGDVDILEATTEEGLEGNPFRIFCFKETNYGMNIMYS